MRRMRGVLVLLNVLTVVLIFVCTTASTSARTLVVFGQDYKKTKAGPTTSTHKFNASRPGTGYTLRVFNGGESGLWTRVASAAVSLNGTQILGPSDFDANTRYLERAVRLESKNTLVVELRGTLASFFVLTIEEKEENRGRDKKDDKDHGEKHNDNRDGKKHEDNDREEKHGDNRDGDKNQNNGNGKGPGNNNGHGNGNPGSNSNGNGGGSTNGGDTVPPTIQGTASPAPNSNGWNNSDVTVSFVCTDAQSGILSCSGSTTISTNGGSQIVTGTAVDNAGNRSTTTVRVNLDKAPPTITATAAPAANTNGWNNTDVTVTFVCADALSGVASCPSPSTVSTNGANQSVMGTVVDNAGNTATTSVRVNLDKNAPGIVATLSPAANASGWNNTNVTVVFACADPLSGITSCPSPITVSTNGANQSLSGTATDKAGNTATTTVTVNLDKTAPTIVGTATPTPNGHGWNNSDVTVTFTCSDALSGTTSCPGPTTLLTDGANQSVPGTTTDKAGNTATTTVTVNLDKSAPGIVATATPAPNANGWNNSNVTVSFICTDNLSGTNGCPGPTTVLTDGAGQSITGTATDFAGNTATTTATVNLDKVSPSIFPTATPAPNAAGWNNSDVTISFNCADALSGTDTCPGPTTLSNNGANQTASGTATDKAGNTMTANATVSIDKGSPNIVATATPAPNAAGWNKTDVTVSFSCSDSLSGIANCPSPETVTTPGAALAVNGTATDNAGNTANTSATINLDKTGPALSLWLPGSTTVTNPDYTLGGTADDALSGLTSVMCNSVSATISGSDFSCTITLVEGPNTIQVLALDVAGNSSTASTTINFVSFVPPALGPIAVSWLNPVGVTSSGNNLTKTGSTAAWNSGATSAEVLKDGYGFIEFTATEVNTMRIAGLGSIDSNQDYTDVDYGTLMRADGTLAIYESGTYRGDYGSYSANDRFRVEVRYGVVRYYRNGACFYTSPAPIRYPLRVDTSFFTPGATLTNVRVGSFVWTDNTGVSISGESVTKTMAAGPGWNAGAISTNTIEYGDGFLEFTASETNSSRIAGLANLVTGTAVSDIQFGVLLQSLGTIEVMEAGSSRGTFGPYSSGDRFRIELRAGVVRYFRNGNPFYTSFQIPSYPLRAETSLDTPGATLTDVRLDQFGWMTNPSIYADGGLMIKKTVDSWATAATIAPAIQTGDGYVEFTAIEVDKRRGVGFKSGGAAGTQAEIDYMISLNETGIVEVLELGTSRGTFGPYRNGDRFRIEVQGGIVRYRKNGAVFFSSATSPAYPLHAEAALFSKSATLVDVEIGDLVWANLVNAHSTGHILLKNSTTTAWDAGASSTRSTTSGFMEFTASEASTYRIAGLSNGDTNQDYTDIDFAILLRSNTTVAVYEAGTFRGDFGNYVAGDRFRVEVQAGTVRYYKNGVLFYTSSIHPMAALRVDTSLNGAGATLFNVVFK